MRLRDFAAKCLGFDLQIALSFLPGNARIHALIGLKIHTPVTMDWGICGFRLAGRLRPKARVQVVHSGRKVSRKSGASPRIANARGVTMRDQKGTEERIAVT
jgi:hypothetical protein